tara:strand:+ start:145 stop:567 length:423 start_codon:yes stop_codon:yes gene_type:complete
MAVFSPDSVSYTIRADQMKILLESWTNSPIIGHGLVSFPDAYFRQSFQFESFYHGLLYQTGIIGVSIFFLTIYTILFGWKLPSINIRKSINITHAIPFSSILFLLGSSTNPFWDNLVIWSFMFYYFNFRINNSQYQIKRN